MRYRFKDLESLADWLGNKGAEKRQMSEHSKMTKSRQRELLAEAVVYEHIAQMMRITTLDNAEENVEELARRIQDASVHANISLRKDFNSNVNSGRTPAYVLAMLLLQRKTVP